MSVADKFRERVEQGYGVIVTNVPPDPDLDGHWSSSLGIRDVFKIARGGRPKS